MGKKERPKGDRPVARRISVFLYSLAGGIGVFALLIGLGCFHNWQQSTWNAIGVGGVAVTIAAVAAAVQIFNRQSIDDAERAQVAETESAVSDFAKEFQASDLLEAASSQPEPDPEKDEQEAQTEAEPGVATIVRIDGDEWRLYPQQNVPLFVLADLVDAWRESAEPGRKDGNWVVRNLVGAARRTGQGSHPWLVVFNNRADERQVYRLYRGGRGNSGRNARNVTRLR